MKEITKEEFEQLPTTHKTFYWTPIKIKLDELEVGSGVIVESEEWKMKTPLQDFVKQSYRKDRTTKKFIAKKILDDSGRVVIFRIN